MERLCDEVLQLIFYELDDPSPLTLVSQRFNRFSKDPYVRAHYFLTHYGPTEAMYYALGRGSVFNERVLDILLSSGAHLSRYLIQLAIHHYFHTQSHFIKTQWVRNVPLRAFAYFLKIAEEMYGEIPRGKGEDDGSVFSTFLKESRAPPQMKTLTWETIRDLMDVYKFIPFCHRDPIMPQFPLALAIEPRLLPHAVANGFSMDYKYRDFVFRKMFERPSLSSETRAEDIANNVRELCKLDPAMFVSRTVAAEVCMEAKLNDIGYSALRQLDKSGDLRFELSTLVEDLLKTFLATRPISSTSIGDVLLHLFSDYPTNDVTVRLVVLIVVFISADTQHLTTADIHTKLDTLGMLPLTRRDAFNILINPFVEKYASVLAFAQEEIGTKEDGSAGMSVEDIEKLVQDVVGRCMEIACKGKLVKKLYDAYPSLKSVINNLILSKYQINVEDVPLREGGSDVSYTAPLSRDFLTFGIGEVHSLESLMPEKEDADVMDVDAEDASAEGAVTVASHAPELGEISQESLSSMIRQDEAIPVRSRRRILYSFSAAETASKLRYPHDPVHVGRWVKQQFGVRSAATAVFMTHAVLNDNCTMLHHFLIGSEPSYNVSSHVPVTLKHFQLLARLEKSPNFYLWHDIENGAEFYVDENDYISKTELERNRNAKHTVKVEPPPSTTASPAPPSGDRKKKRPRRSAASTVLSYVIPDSDDEGIAGEQSLIVEPVERKKPGETSLQLWIKHLGLLLKAETRKYTLLKRQNENPGVRVPKNEFVKSLAANLRTLRKRESEYRIKYRYDDFLLDVSDAEDDEEYKIRQPKRRKTTQAV